MYDYASGLGLAPNSNLPKNTSNRKRKHQRYENLVVFVPGVFNPYYYHYYHFTIIITIRRLIRMELR